VSNVETSVEVIEAEVFDEERMREIKTIPSRSPALDQEVELVLSN
jgi:hypothetical protein